MIPMIMQMESNRLSRRDGNDSAPGVVPIATV